jgi:hypothetical protein
MGIVGSQILSTIRDLIERHRTLQESYQVIAVGYSDTDCVKQPFHYVYRAEIGTKQTEAQQAIGEWRIRACDVMESLRRVYRGREEDLVDFPLSGLGVGFHQGITGNEILAALARHIVLLKEDVALLQECEEPRAGVKGEQPIPTQVDLGKAWKQGGWPKRLKDHRTAFGHTQAGAAHECSSQATAAQGNAVTENAYRRWESMAKSGRSPHPTNLTGVQKYLKLSPGSSKPTAD